MDSLSINMWGGEWSKTSSSTVYSKLYAGLSTTTVGLASLNYALSLVTLGNQDIYDTIAFFVSIFTSS